MTKVSQNPVPNQDPSSWPVWTDQVRWTVTKDIVSADSDIPSADLDILDRLDGPEGFRPSPSDEREAVFLFGETATYEAEDRFSAWVDDLPAERFRSVRHALDVLREALRDFQTEEDALTMDQWLTLCAPEDENYAVHHYDEISVVDCHGISDSRFGGFIDL